jgi:spermidine/putrescine transport system substrate-binding protein
MNRNEISGKMMKAAVFCVAALFCMSCEKKERLYIYNWTYYTPDSVIEKFENEYNVEVVYDLFDSNEMMHSKIISGGGKGYDIVFPSGDFVSIMIKEDLFEKINHDLLKNIGNIDPAVLEQTPYDYNMEYSVPYYWGASGIYVNKAKVPNYEESWSIFSREDLKGKMTMLDDGRDVLGDALILLGYSVNSEKEAEIFAARDLVENTWKPNLARFDSDSFGKNFANGEFWVVQGYPEAVFQEILSDKEMLNNSEFFIPKEGGSSYIDSMCILKGSKNIELAHKFIDFIHRPEIYAEFCDVFYFPATVNQAARPLLKNKPLYSESDLKRTQNKEDVGDAVNIYANAWQNTIRSGN